MLSSPTSAPPATSAAPFVLTTGRKISAFAGALIALLASVAPVAPAFAQSAASPYTSAARFDAMGRQTGAISADPDGTGPLGFQAVRNSYDAAGRLTKVEKGALSSWQSEAVAPANWTGFTVFQTVDTVYDALDRKTKETVSGVEPVGGATTIASVTQFSYDNLGRLECTAQRMNSAVFSSLPASACTLGTQGSQGPDRIVKSVHDAAGQLRQVREAVGTTDEAAEATRTYTNNGLLKQLIDANGNRAEMRYDGHDRLTRWVFPSATRPAAYDPATPASADTSAGALNEADYEQYGSDANGNRTSLRKRDGSTLTFQYDALNRMSVKVVPERSGLAPTHTRDVHYEHDLRGLQTKARFDSLTGEGVSASYDGFGRLASSSINMGGTTRSLSAQYNRSGGRTELTYPDAVKMNFAHDGLDRMTGVLEGALGAGVSLATIGYDDRGQRSSMTRRGGDATSYGFDGVSRLKTLGDTFVGGSGNSTSTFGYNMASQITGLTRSNDAYAYTASNETRSYAVNGLNQYTAVAGLTQAHDANGNLTSDGTTTYSYDVENRMVGASNGASLAYDPMGRLFQTTGTSIGTTQFLYDGDELVAEYDGSGALTKRYVHGAGVDDPLVWYEGSTLTAPRYLHTDHQGSVTSIAKADGTLLNINRYDEYGVAAGGNIGRFGYTGQIWLPEVARWHYKSRTYDAKNGRFDQIDTIGYDGALNIYEYADSNPVNVVDPDGTLPDIIIDVGLIVVDVADIKQNGLNWTNGISLGANVLGAAIPGATGLGPLTRLGGNGADARRVQRQRELRNQRREDRSREQVGQNKTGSNQERYERKQEGKKGPGGTRPTREASPGKTQRGVNRKAGDDGIDNRARQKERGERRRRDED